MSDAAVKPQGSWRGFVIRFLIGLVVVMGLIVLSAGGRLDALAGYVGQAGYHLHAPDFSGVASASPAIKIHLAAALIAFGLGAVQLIRVKGTRVHRILGWTWVVILGTAAVSSFFIRVVNHGSFSFIHILSAWTLIALPLGVYAARRHNIVRHGRLMTGLFLGALVVAGILTFLPGRLMWRIFFG